MTVHVLVLADNVHLKVLIPSIAAGAIIGKGGETITQIQKDTGATVKMSKNNDFYPGIKGHILHLFVQRCFKSFVEQ